MKHSSTALPLLAAFSVWQMCGPGMVAGGPIRLQLGQPIPLHLETFPTTSLTCSLLEENADDRRARYGDPPEWQPVTTPEQRWMVIKEAWTRAQHALMKCGPVDVGILRYPACAWNEVIRDGVRYSIGYAKVQREPEAAARSLIGGDNLKVDHYWDPYTGNLVPAEQHERYYIYLEIFPAVFERGELFMPSETETAEGPWARDLVEAMTYVVLHEIGHLEAYVAKNTKTHGTQPGGPVWQLPITPMPLCPKGIITPDDVCEKAANEFASSALRCQRRTLR